MLVFKMKEVDREPIVTSDEKRANITLIQDDKLSFGDRLKSSREAAKLSVQDAASRLHLSPKFILMLENDDLLASTLPPIYLRGYLRSYARLLNLPESEINQVLAKLEPTPAILTPVAAPTEAATLAFPIESLGNYSRLATVFFSLLLVTSVTTWWYLHGNSPTPTVIALSSSLSSEQSVPEANLVTLPSNMVALNTNSPVTPSALPPSNVGTPTPLAQETPAPSASSLKETPSKPNTAAVKTDEVEDDGSDE